MGSSASHGRGLAGVGSPSNSFFINLGAGAETALVPGVTLGADDVLIVDRIEVAVVDTAAGTPAATQETTLLVKNDTAANSGDELHRLKATGVHQGWDGRLVGKPGTMMILSADPNLSGAHELHATVYVTAVQG